MGIETQDKGSGQAPPRNPGEALDGVLDALQGMLERRHVVPPGMPGGAPVGPAPREPTTDEDDLPVLDQVVVPGAVAGSPWPLAPEHGPESVAAARPAEPATEPPTEPLELLGAAALPAYDDLVKRLASEVEIIIESSLHESLARAHKDIRARIKQHLDIVLPEILEELRVRTSGEEVRR
jgi:hypothetical protein